MVKIIIKKGKKYLNIDGKEYGPKALYFHIKRSISTLEYFTKSGDWDEKRQREVKSSIQRLIDIKNEHYPDDNIWWWFSFAKTNKTVLHLIKTRLIDKEIVFLPIL